MARDKYDRSPLTLCRLDFYIWSPLTFKHFLKYFFYCALLGTIIAYIPLSLRTSMMIAYLTAVSEDKYVDCLPYRCLWGRVWWSLTLLLSLRTSIMMAYLTAVSEDEYYDCLPYRCLWGRVWWSPTLPLSLRTSIMIVHLLPLPPRMSRMLTMTARTIRPAIQVSWPRVIWL